MSEQQTILEGIIVDVAADLYNKWAEALPEAERNQQAFSAMSSNAHETTIYVIQNFMKRFNDAANELKGNDTGQA